MQATAAREKAVHPTLLAAPIAAIAEPRQYLEEVTAAARDALIGEISACH